MQQNLNPLHSKHPLHRAHSTVTSILVVGRPHGFYRSVRLPSLPEVLTMRSRSLRLLFIHHLPETPELWSSLSATQLVAVFHVCIAN